MGAGVRHDVGTRSSGCAQTLSRLGERAARSRSGSSPTSRCRTSRAGRWRSSGGSGCCTVTSRTASGCRSRTRAGRVEEMEAIAIDEWMGASPIYSVRTQRALNFAGDGVDTIMKNLQFDIGAPHHFMDFRCTVHDHDHGEFFLAHCGALMDVEPMGEDYVRGMCHTIEDPTFDATAVAHEPARADPPDPPTAARPRRPASALPLDGHDRRVASSRRRRTRTLRSSSARSPRSCAVDDPGASTEPGRMGRLLGPVRHRLRARGPLPARAVLALQEFAVQSHLLLRGVLPRRRGTDRVRTKRSRNVAQMAVGLGGVTAERLTRRFRPR